MRRLMLAAAAALWLCSCGSNNTFSPVVEGPCQPPAIAGKLLGKVWIGQIQCGSTTRLVRLTFSESNCSVLVTGQSLIYNGLTDVAYPGNGMVDPNTFNTLPGVPVTINGDKATFAMLFSVVNPSNNKTIGGPLLVVPGTTAPISFTVTIGDGSLNGTYSTEARVDPQSQGTACFTPETVLPADVSGHWTGDMTAETNGNDTAGTLDITLAMTGSVVTLTSQGSLTTTNESVQLNPDIGVSGIVIGNQILFGITFERINVPVGQQIHHRWFLGTINGNSITGEYSNVVGVKGQGTFTLTRGGQAQ